MRVLSARRSESRRAFFLCACSLDDRRQQTLVDLAQIHKAHRDPMAFAVRFRFVDAHDLRVQPERIPGFAARYLHLNGFPYRKRYMPVEQGTRRREIQGARMQDETTLLIFVKEL